MKKGLKISELVKKTGVAKSTILYYVKIGLLPKPTKTSPNMAYYDESFIEKILLIKELQQSKFLPLEHIKWFLNRMEQRDHPTQLIAEVLSMNFDSSKKKQMTYTREQFLSITGLGEELLADLESRKMIIPLHSGNFYYDDDDVEHAERLRKIFEIGVSPEMINYVSEYISKIVEKNMELHSKFADKYFGVEHETFIKITDVLVESAVGAREYLFNRHFREKLGEHVQQGWCPGCKTNNDVEDKDDEEKE